MTIDTDKLREICQAATPGPYYLRTNRHPNTDGTKWGWLDLYESGSMDKGSPSGVNVTWSEGKQSQNNARFLAAANPATILALLDELDRLQAQNSNLLRRLGGEDDFGKLLFETNEQLREMNNAAHLVGYRLAQEQAEGICDDNELYQTALEIRALQPPAEWGVE